MIEVLFNQEAVWREVLPSKNSLSKEASNEHTLGSVRISPRKSGSTADTMGYRDDSNATLFFHAQKSSVDGRRGTFPMIKRGDVVMYGGMSLTVVGFTVCSGLDGKDHHMEVSLR